MKNFLYTVLTAVLGSYLVLYVLPDLFTQAADNSELDNATGNDFTVDIIRLTLTIGAIIMIVALWITGSD